MEVMDKRGENYEKGFYSIAVYDTSCKHLKNVKYYEYWMYGEKMQHDYKTSRLSDDEAEAEGGSNHDDNNNNRNPQFLGNMMHPQKMMKLEL